MILPTVRSTTFALRRVRTGRAGASHDELIALPYSALLPLEGVVRDYSWGSPTAIPQLLGRPPTGAPAAELWLGAHPAVQPRSSAPDATSPRSSPPAPSSCFGPDILARFGAELPFLMKVIAPAKRTVDPGPSDARAGRGGLRGGGGARHPAQRSRVGTTRIPTTSPRWCVHSPRSRRSVASARRRTRCAFSRQWRCRSWRCSRPCCPQPTGSGAHLALLLTRNRIAPARSSMASPAAASGFSAVEGEWSDNADAIVAVAHEFPSDIGVALVALLNYVALGPARMWSSVPPGTVHCYLGGLAVEVMASSDNDAAGGLTPKHVDVAELLRGGEFRRDAALRYADRTSSTKSPGYDPSDPEFQLSIHEFLGFDQNSSRWSAGSACSPVGRHTSRSTESIASSRRVPPPSWLRDTLCSWLGARPFSGQRRGS